MKSLKSGVLLVSVLWATASFAQGVNLGGGNKFRGLGPDPTPAPSPSPSSLAIPGVSQLIKDSAKDVELRTLSLPGCELTSDIVKAAPAGIFNLVRPLWAAYYSYYKNAPTSEMKNAELQEMAQSCEEIKMDIANSDLYVGYDKAVEEQKLQTDLSNFEQAMKQAGDNMGSAKGKFAGSAQ